VGSPDAGISRARVYSRGAAGRGGTPQLWLRTVQKRLLRWIGESAFVAFAPHPSNSQTPRRYRGLLNPPVALFLTWHFPSCSAPFAGPRGWFCESGSRSAEGGR